ncbi:MAG: hypothetical protein E6Z86_14955 [Clostridium butyricum]|nr:hypothetical protein [Clostridium butyricum]MDU5820952.1 hypothetical protein [Clostridium butyricum]
MNYKGKMLSFIKGKKIGHGGNSNLYEISCDQSSQKELVAKFLNNPNKLRFNQEKYERFKREVDAMLKLGAEIEGIIKIIDFNLP